MTQELPYILVVDDDPDDSGIICKALDELGGVYCTVVNYGEGVIDFLNQSILNGKFPSLVILDFNMPRINGDRLLSLIKRNENFKDLPVIIYSTYLPIQLREILLSQGALECYVKPTNYATLLDQTKVFKELALNFFKMSNATYNCKANAE